MISNKATKTPFLFENRDVCTYEWCELKNYKLTVDIPQVTQEWRDEMS